MAFEDFVLPTEEVQLPGGSTFAVRGLSLQDITLLISKHGPVMEEFFRRYSGDDKANPMEIGMGLVAQAPVLVAQIIAIAADRADKVETVLKFPLVTQQDALEKLAKLTFDANGGPKKFVEAVLRLVKSTTNLLSDLPR